MGNKSGLIDLLSNYFESTYGISQIAENKYLIRDLNLDSLNLVDLSIYLQDKFHVTIDFRNDMTIGEIIETLQRR